MRFEDGNPEICKEKEKIMMKVNRKKWLCGLAAILCLAGGTVPTFADTVKFDITVPGDVVSKRVVKADDEQKFYVTGTNFSGSGTLCCTSSRLHATTTFHVAEISKNNPSSNAPYKSYAQPKYEYFMHCTASTSGLHVLGRYTP